MSIFDLFVKFLIKHYQYPFIIIYIDLSINKCETTLTDPLQKCNPRSPNTHDLILVDCIVCKVNLFNLTKVFKLPV